jgi:hypothetical protein
MKEFQIDKNSITLDGLSDLKQDFKNLLTIKDSVIYKNCDNVDVKIDSLINKLIIKNSKNIKILVYKMVSGIELINCKNVILTCTEGKPIYNLYIESSVDLEIILDKKIFNSTEIDVIDSGKILFSDFDNNKIFKV